MKAEGGGKREGKLIGGRVEEWGMIDWWRDIEKGWRGNC